MPDDARKKLLVLHGNRQTGQLLLGRMDKLRKKLKAVGVDLVAIDAPFVYHDDNSNKKNDDKRNADEDEPSSSTISISAPMRTWWNRNEIENTYVGLDDSFNLVQTTWCNTNNSTDDHECIGLLGFSQGARLVHLLCQRHAVDASFLPGLKCAILVAGYDAPLPSNPCIAVAAAAPSLKIVRNKVSTPTLHVWGDADALIRPEQSRSLQQYYEIAESHVHDGGHHVPMRAASVRLYVEFVQRHVIGGPEKVVVTASSNSSASMKKEAMGPPDEERAHQQAEEVEALQAIFPDEFTLLSRCSDDGIFQHPISYQLSLTPSDEGIWPPRPVTLRVTCPPTYPSETTALPLLTLTHENNGVQFTSGQTAACLAAMTEAAEQEAGMPSVLTCFYAARDFFESGRMAAACIDAKGAHGDAAADVQIREEVRAPNEPLHLTAASEERIADCNLQGLAIAEKLLALKGAQDCEEVKGGSWLYTIGLVGKPSAGKSTLFNTATGFARQKRHAAMAASESRQQKAENADPIGGATMAPHPFTTIDPNIGFCLVPAPPGSCPQGDESMAGSTHGRDSLGRRMLPVLLKDVAGLVPGAYQGRGRGNQFLNDLTDADVLIHVLDASGMADTEGNVVVMEGENNDKVTHPQNDMAWIRNELIEWVYTNLVHKWETIRRKGRVKLAAMFSGYGQTQAMTWSILNNLERFMEEETGIGLTRALDHMDQWDAGDVHRLVSAFLGVRFPIALALNKNDLPLSKHHIEDILESLPMHGTHTGTPLSARKEMMFSRHYIEATLHGRDPSNTGHDASSTEIPLGTWQCLQSAISLRCPTLVFPVSDHTTYAPMTGMTQYASSDASLPSPGMIACLQAAGGHAPTEWDSTLSQYLTANNKAGGGNHSKKASSPKVALRDALMMKPGSTVEDVFLTLKRLGALGGEFVRAEASSEMGVPPKPIPKYQLVDVSNRIIKIMTTKRTAWQT